MEAAGARAVPIPWDASSATLQSYFNATNGLLFPGGGTNLHTGAYRATGAELLRLATAANEAGDVYPVWGTCLGFEELMLLTGLSTLNRTAGVDGTLLQTGAYTDYWLVDSAAATTQLACQCTAHWKMHCQTIGLGRPVRQPEPALRPTH